MNNKWLTGLLVAGGLVATTTALNTNNAQATTYNYKAATSKVAPYTKLYDANGKLIAARVLPVDTDWRVGEIHTIDGITYFQVATKEWTKASDMDPNFDPSTGELLQGDFVDNKPTGYDYNVARVVKDGSKVYDSQGLATSKGVAKNSDWKVLRTFKLHGVLFYEIGANQWLSEEDCSTNFTPIVENGSSNSTTGGNSAAASGSSSTANDSNESSNTSSITDNNSSANSSNTNSNGDSSSSSSNSSNSKPFNTNGAYGAADWYVPIQHEPNSAYQQAILDFINSRRSSKGEAPLTVNPKLTQGATIRIDEESSREVGNIPGRPDGTSWWSVLSDVGYNWSYARELNLMFSDDLYDRSMYDTPRKVAHALIGTYDTAGQSYVDSYMSPEAKEMGAAVTYTHNDGRVYTDIIIGTQESDD